MLVLKDSVLVDSDGQSVSFRDITGTTSSTAYGVGGNISLLDVDAVVIEIGTATTLVEGTELSDGDTFLQFHKYIKTAGSSAVINGKTFTIGEYFCPQVTGLTVPTGDTWEWTGYYRPQILTTWLPNSGETALNLDVSELGQDGSYVETNAYVFDYSIFANNFSVSTAAVSGNTYLVIGGTATYLGDSYVAGETFIASGTTNIVPSGGGAVGIMYATSTTYFVLAYELLQQILIAIEAQITAFSPRTQNNIFAIRAQLEALENSAATNNISFDYCVELLAKLQSEMLYILNNNS
jgi:hypothetical protein